MELSTQDIQDLVNSFGEVCETRQHELDITAEEDFAESDLVTAQEATTDKVDAFKALVAAKLLSGGVPIVQETDALRSTEPTVTMPYSIGCTCRDTPTPPPPPID